MLLSQLLSNKVLSHDPDITALCEDSRRAGPGSLFFAMPGSKDDGLRHINDAIQNGAEAIVVPDRAGEIEGIPSHIPVIHTPDPRVFIAICAARLYPQQPIHIVAVTGTSGKTSTTYFVQQILNALGISAASIGTLGVCGAVTRPGKLTTPEAPELHRMLDELARAHVSAVAIEASSQALAQSRMEAVRIRAAAFINLSHDHLDYHGTMAAYLSAKKILFTRILPVEGVAVLNADDAVYDDIRNIAQKRGIRVISFGRNPTADIHLTAHQLIHHGQRLTFSAMGVPCVLSVGMAGEFQGQNILCAIGLCLALGFEVTGIIEAAQNLIAPPGRLQPIEGHPTGAAIYIDYAHKPDALESVLSALRAHQPRRLVCVFGCGGDRDAGKRPMMGEIAARLADTVIITDDNPRSEDPATIRAAIKAAAINAIEIGDRAAAIDTAVRMLEDGDILLVAGKGHETGQIFATHTIPFNDAEAVTTAIQSLTDHSSPSLSSRSAP